MAKRASPAKSAATGRKRAAAKPKAKSTARKPAARKKSSAPRSVGRRATDLTAADALFKLLESPLVADLLAVGAIAALAAITESRHSRKSGADSKSSKALKSAAKAAAAAIGRRLSTEFEEIKKASKKARPTAKA